jgi:hypothetical protein
VKAFVMGVDLSRVRRALLGTSPLEEKRLTESQEKRLTRIPQAFAHFQKCTPPYFSCKYASTLWIW